MSPAILDAVSRILLTLWVGGMWVTGYMAAPVLFTMLERQMAGSVAGQMFTIMSNIGLLCGSGLLLLGLARSGAAYVRSWRGWAVAAMLLLVIVGQFVLQPMMVELRATGLLAGSTEAASFGRLHGMASILFMASSVLGLLLVAKKPA